jgi:hypothetical protein
VSTPIRTTTEDELAQQFPQLEILELLEQGPAGLLYKARQPRQGRWVTLRILPSELGRDRASVDRFHREVAALATLSHPNIAAVLEAGAEGRCYVVSEFGEGASLRELLKAGRLAPHKAAAIISQICDALQYAHNNGFVHGNLNPDKILVDRKGNVKVADFALGRLLGDGPACHGSPGADPQPDLRALGAVIWEMLTGEPPAATSFPPFQNGAHDARWQEVLLRTFDTHPARRYQRVADLKAAVERIGRERANAEAPRRSRRRSLAAAAALVVAVYGFLVIPAVREMWPQVRPGMWRVSNWFRSQPARTRQFRGFGRSEPLVQELPRFWTFTPDGPNLAKAEAARLELQPDQLALVNAVLKVTYQEYLHLEHQHWLQERDATGRLVTTIAPFAVEFEQLENRFWSKLDLILDEAQQQRARSLLTLRLPFEALAPERTGAAGLFGWSGETARIEISRDSNGYQWTIEARGHTQTQTAAALPKELERFWTESGT